MGKASWSHQVLEQGSRVEAENLNLDQDWDDYSNDRSSFD